MKNPLYGRSIGMVGDTDNLVQFEVEHDRVRIWVLVKLVSVQLGDGVWILVRGN